MKFHNKSVFEEQLEIQLDPKGNAVIGNITYSPVAILRMDKTGYDTLFQDWLDQIWIPDQKERLEEILSIAENRGRFHSLCVEIEKKRVVPLVGSGMSVPMGLPTWSNFLRSIRKSSPTLLEGDLESLLQRSEFEEAAEKLMENMSSRLFENRIRQDLFVKPDSEIVGAIQFLPEIFESLVLTTNLDNLLELLYEKREKKFGYELIGTKIGEYRNLHDDQKTFLLKLHGDHKSKEGRVLSRTEYEKAYGKRGNIRKELALIAETKNILCIGCSLSEDRTVKLIADLAINDEHMPTHYAFLQLPESSGLRLKRENILADCNIFPIWYDGDHDLSLQALFIGILGYLEKI